MEKKQPFPIMVRLWLNHKVVLSYKTNHYKAPEIATSLRMCQDIAKMVRANCDGYNIAGICRMILMYQNYLRKILPHPYNSSYESSLLKLEEIISYAKNHLKTKTC